MERNTDKREIVGSTTITVEYIGSAVDGGLMDLGQLVPALDGLRQALLISDQRLNHGATSAQALISATTRAASYEFVIVVQQLLTASQSLFSGENLRTAIDLTKIVFGDKGLVELIKIARGESKEQVLSHQNAVGGIQIIGDNNMVYNFGPEVGTLYRSDAVREAIARSIQPLKSDGIDTVEFRPSQGGLSRVETNEAGFYDQRPEPDFSKPEFTALESIVSIVKVSFDPRKRWKFETVDSVFGAYMSDHEFQARVSRRELGFFKGDRLRVRIYRRQFPVNRRQKRQRKPEFYVAKVVEVIRPEDDDTREQLF